MGVSAFNSACATTNGLDLVADHHEMTKQVFPVFGGETETWGAVLLAIEREKNSRDCRWLMERPRAGKRTANSLIS